MNGLERIIYIDIDCYNELNYTEPKTLIIELMGKHSNIILVDQANKIIDSLRHLSRLDNSNRDILPGCIYTLNQDSKSDFISTSFDDFYTTLQNDNENLSTAISKHYTGIGKSGIQFVLNNLSITDATNISKDDYQIVYDAIKQLIESENFKIISENDDFYIQKTEEINQDSYLLNFFIDDFYYDKETKQNIIILKNHLLSLILTKTKRLKSKSEKLNKTLLECSQIDNYKLYGELILSNIYKFDNKSLDSITLIKKLLFL